MHHNISTLTSDPCPTTMTNTLNTQTINSYISKAAHTSSQENIRSTCISDDDDAGVSEGELWAPLAVRGYLSKWTNLLHGWQERYFVLSDGFLTYYRNSDDMDLGSRGSIRIKNAYVKTHEYDECRFEVRVGDVIWYLRGLSQEERYNWISAIERHRIAESGYGSEKATHHHSSLLSLNSTCSPSIHSASSYKRNHGLREKLAEMETFKEILCKQVDSLQAYFDACSAIVQHGAHDNLESWLTNESNLTRSSSSSSSCSYPLYYSKEKVDYVAADDDDDVGLQDERKQCPRKISKSTGNNKSVNADNITSYQCSTLVDSSMETVSSTLHLSNVNVQSSIHQSDSSQPPKIDHQSIITDKDSNNTTRSGGFFSRFLPFRNFSSGQTVQTVVESDNVDVKDDTTNDNVTTTGSIENDTSQYRPSSRFNDLRRILQQHGGHALDFKGEAHMFKAITAGILTNLSHSVDMMQQHEEQWRKRLEREIERRRRLEETQRAITQELLHLRSLIGLSTTMTSANMITSNHLTHNHPSHSRFASYGSSLDFKHFLSDNFKESILKCNGNVMSNIVGCDGVPGVNSTSTSVNENIRRLVGPDYEEGLASPIREEEFFDAIDAESDKMEQNEVRLAALKSASEAIRSARAMPFNHPLYSELDKVIKMHMKNFASTKIFDYASKLCSTTSSLFSSSSSSAATLSAASADIDSQEDNDNSSSSGTGNSQSEIPEKWRIVVQDGDMVIFRRELVSDDGIVLDPLQAVHVVHGVTAREMCTYFWDVRYRMDWEFTVDRAPDVLEVCGDDTVVTYQVYKRVWPTTQRDSLFWSHICPVNPIQTNPSRKLNHKSSMSSGRYNIQQSKLHKRSASMGTNLTTKGLSSQSTTTVNCNPDIVDSSKESNTITNSSDNILDGWMVVNMSTNYLSDKIPSSTSPTIRLGLEVVLFCRTEILSNSLAIHSSTNDLTKLSRDQLCTRLVYMANINPGGWVPAAGLRSLAQREYPRFLKRFSTYVKEQTQHRSPLF
ncbi:Collagen type IV alpha-3-binding protein [Schistosoma japonicum]|nr:Collagen type IV alpha-3-binding protein [Schistosoma japonicum]